MFVDRLRTRVDQALMIILFILYTLSWMTISYKVMSSLFSANSVRKNCPYQWDSIILSRRHSLRKDERWMKFEQKSTQRNKHPCYVPSDGENLNHLEEEL